MHTHAIVQLEEGALNLLVGTRRESEVAILRSVRFPLTDLSRPAVENTLKNIGSDLLHGARGVHVVIGERRAFHQLATVPKLSAKDALAFVSREALRHASIPQRDDLLLSTRLVRRLGDGRLEIAVAAFSRALWRPIAEAFDAQQLPVLSLQTMESCLAMAAESRGAEPVAMLECNGNRARFLLCRDGVAMQVRRFLISGGTGDNEMALATQLTMELPRTMDWLRESGQGVPRRLVIGTRVGLGEESMGMLMIDDGTTVARCQLPVSIESGQSMPDIGIATLMQRLVSGGSTRSLLDPPQLQLPLGRAVIAGTLAAAGLVVLGGTSAVVDAGRWLTARELHRSTAAEAAALELQLARDAVPDDAAQEAQDPWLSMALRMRRPMSRMIAEISNQADEHVTIESLQCASEERVIIVGHVESDTRQEALSALVAFHKHIDELPFLLSTEEEQVEETASGYSFRLGLAWRNP